MNLPIENFYRRNEGLLQIVGILGLPIAFTIIGIFVTISVERFKLHQAEIMERSKMHQEEMLKRISTQEEYVKIATGILSRKVDKDQNTAIREWAVDILSLYSPIEIKKEQRDDLITGVSRTAWYGLDYTAGYADYDFYANREKRESEQPGAGQPATRPESDSGDCDKP